MNRTSRLTPALIERGSVDRAPAMGDVPREAVKLRAAIETSPTNLTLAGLSEMLILWHCAFVEARDARTR